MAIYSDYQTISRGHQRKASNSTHSGSNKKFPFKRINVSLVLSVISCLDKENCIVFSFLSRISINFYALGTQRHMKRG